MYRIDSSTYSPVKFMSFPLSSLIKSERTNSLYFACNFYSLLINSVANREARLKLTTSALFDSLDRYELQECLSHLQTHWMLSIDDFKIPTEPPSGLISQLTPLKSNHCWVLVSLHIIVHFWKDKISKPEICRVEIPDY